MWGFFVCFFYWKISFSLSFGSEVKLKSQRLRAEFDLSCAQTEALPLQQCSAAGIGQAGSYLLLGHKHLF